jgi:hypothetical protein
MEQFPDREPVRVTGSALVPERCCYCGERAASGIYLRADPSEPQHHTDHEVDVA